MVKLIAMSGGKASLLALGQPALVDFSSSFTPDFAISNYSVFDDTTLLAGTDDGGGEKTFNFRAVLSSAAFTVAPAQQKCQLEFRFGASSSSVAAAISSVYFGQAGASSPNFAGDQVQVKFAGAAAINNSSAASLVLSDVFTLAQPFDDTKNYVCSFFVNASVASLATTLADSNVTMWTDSGAVGSNEAALTTPTASSYTSTVGALTFLERIIL